MVSAPLLPRTTGSGSGVPGVAVDCGPDGRAVPAVLVAAAAGATVVAPFTGSYRWQPAGTPISSILGTLSDDAVIAYLDDARQQLLAVEGFPAPDIRFVAFGDVEASSFADLVRHRAELLDPARLDRWWDRQPAARRAELAALAGDLLGRFTAAVVNGWDSMFFEDGSELGAVDGAGSFVGLRIAAFTDNAAVSAVRFVDELADVAPTAVQLRQHPLWSALCRVEQDSLHIQHRSRFRAAGSVVRDFTYPREYTNPTGSGHGSGSAPHVPDRVGAVEVACRSVSPPAGLVVRNWAAGDVWHYSTRRDVVGRTEVRSLRHLRALIIHDTIGPLDFNERNPWWSRPSADPESAYRNAVAAHLLVEQAGRVYQFADLVEEVNHASGHNTASVGIEVANPFEPPPGTPADRIINTPMGRSGDENVLVPPVDSLEALWALVAWLTGPAQPLGIPLVFPQLNPGSWTSAEHDTRSAFAANRPGVALDPGEWADIEADHPDGVWLVDHFQRGPDDCPATPILEPDTVGVYAHGAFSCGKRDGVVSVPYLLRRSRGDDNTTALRAVRDLLEQPGFVVGYDRFVDLPASWR